ncbi:MAG: amino acid ABC transporter permease, partial [Oscillospiraceae bacterium]|nr:amino acid ABC transporter permease [Oscillospiraceae bacterium]
MFESFGRWLDWMAQRFHTAFLEAGRWKLYLQGLGVTLEMTVAALVL